MLSRTADSLYWIARYMERAENLSRILRVTDRLTLMPGNAEGAGNAKGIGNEWHSTLVVSDCEHGFYEKYDEATPEHVISYLAFDPDNPSSIRSCIDAARRNARSVRTALTSEQWESLNATWLELSRMKESRLRGGGLHGFLDWVKERTLMFHGGTVATMLRRDSFHFMQLFPQTILQYPGLFPLPHTAPCRFFLSGSRAYQHETDKRRLRCWQLPFLLPRSYFQEL